MQCSFYDSCQNHLSVLHINLYFLFSLFYLFFFYTSLISIFIYREINLCFIERHYYKYLLLISLKQYFIYDSGKAIFLFENLERCTFSLNIIKNATVLHVTFSDISKKETNCQRPLFMYALLCFVCITMHYVIFLNHYLLKTKKQRSKENSTTIKLPLPEQALYKKN